jgi:quercetin dioxygenase-like cupin family protein
MHGSQSGHFSPDDMKWQDGPPALPPGAKFVVLEGDPTKTGVFTMRVRLPDGYRVPLHTHPDVERVTILAGTLHLVMEDSEKVLPAGSFAYMPKGMRHHAWVKGTTDLQLTCNGPWGVHYVNPADDPRKK